MATKTAFQLMLLLAVAGTTLAQFGLFRPPSPPPPPGAGKSVKDVACALQDYSRLCKLITSAESDPTVAELTDPTFTGTVFIPDNKAFDDTSRQLTRTLGIGSINDLPTKPNVAARVLANHIITGENLQYGQLKNGQKFRNALGQTLEIDSGLLGGLYVKGPVNTVKISSQGGKNNIPAARAVLHNIDGVLIPKK